MSSSIAGAVSKQSSIKTTKPGAASEVSLTVQPFTRGEESEVLSFLEANPLHTVFMAGFIRDNGIVSELKVKDIKFMPGEHDASLDHGKAFQEFFGATHYTFDHKGVHFVTIMSVQEKDFWTARGMTPMERMKTVAGLDNGVQSRFEVGDAGREWLKNDLAILYSEANSIEIP